MRTKEYRVELTDEERATLLVLVRRGKAAARTLTRAHILLAAGEDTYDAATAAALHVSTKTVERVRHRFAQAPPGDRLRWALDDLPRPGAAPKLDAAAEAQLVALACTAPPDKRTVWTMQLLADRAEARTAPHAQARELAEHGRARTRGARPAVPRPTAAESRGRRRGGGAVGDEAQRRAGEGTTGAARTKLARLYPALPS